MEAPEHDFGFRFGYFLYTVTLDIELLSLFYAVLDQSCLTKNVPSNKYFQLGPDG